MSNIIILSDVTAADITGLLDMAFAKISNNCSENLFMLVSSGLIQYVNLVEKLVGQVDRPEVQSALLSKKQQIIDSMKTVPLLLKHTSENIQKKFDLRFPRKVVITPMPLYFKTSLDLVKNEFIVAGTACKRYRPGAVIETGTLFMDKAFKHVVFQRSNSVSVASRDLIFLGDILKVEKVFDDRSTFFEAVKK
jgi:hypothetical protein